MLHRAVTNMSVEWLHRAAVGALWKINCRPVPSIHQERCAADVTSLKGTMDAATLIRSDARGEPLGA